MATFEFKNISDVAKSDISFGDQYIFTGWPDLEADQDMAVYFEAFDKAKIKRDRIDEEVQKKVEKDKSNNGVAKDKK